MNAHRIIALAALLIVIVAPLACSSEGGGTGTGTGQAAQASLQAGTGKDGFVTLTDGEAVELFHGPQGGTHIWGAFREKGLKPGLLSVTYTLSLPGASEPISSATYDIEPVTVGEWGEWAGLIGFVPEPAAVIGKQVVLSIVAKDASNAEAGDFHTVVVQDGAVTGGVGSGTDGGTRGGCEGDVTVRPGARGDFAAGIDAALGKLVVFGGDVGVPVKCSPAPAFNGETWVYDIGCGRWQLVDGANGPSARARSASAVDEATHKLYVYGGRYRAGSSGAYTQFNETWAFDIATLTWSKVATTGGPAAGLTNATMAHHPVRNALYLFGGNSSSSGLTLTPSNALWKLDLATGAWSRLNPVGQAPAARQYHAMALDAAGDRLYVYAGGDAGAFTGPFLKDVWSYDLKADRWEEISTTGGEGVGRMRTGLAFDGSKKRLLAFGGHDDGSQGERNDLAALDLATSKWSLVRPGDALYGASRGFCDFPPDFTTADLASPERREAFFLGFDATRARFWLFGGKTDCGNVNDLWSFDPATDAWTNVERAFSGESCLRSGKQGCTSLCF